MIFMFYGINILKNKAIVMSLQTGDSTWPLIQSDRWELMELIAKKWSQYQVIFVFFDRK